MARCRWSSVRSSAERSSRSFPVIRGTAKGDDEPPWFVDFVGLGDLLRPYFSYVLLVFVTFAPALMVLIVEGPFPALFVALLGLLYLPAGTISAALARSYFGGLNVVAVARIIARVPRAYALVALAHVVLAPIAGAILYTGQGLALKYNFALPFVTSLIYVPLAMYLPTVLARMLGLFLREHVAELPHD